MQRANGNRIDVGARMANPHTSIGLGGWGQPAAAVMVLYSTTTNKTNNGGGSMQRANGNPH